MPISARDNYLAADVQSASPQKLQLLLIEAALRSAQRAGQQWQANQDEAALQSLLHAQAVMSELMCGLRKEVATDLTDRVMALYVYIFRCLVEAGMGRDEKKLADAVGLLQIERETWRLLCEKLAIHHRPDSAATVPPPAGLRGLPVMDSMDAMSGGFSMEA